MEFKIKDKIVFFEPMLVNSYLLYKKQYVAVYNLNLAKPFDNKKIDIKLIERELEKTIKQKDKEFVKIKDCDSKKFAYIFDIEKWVKRNINNSNLIKIDSFSIKLKFKNSLPEQFKGLDINFSNLIKQNLTEKIISKITNNINKYNIEYNEDSNIVLISLKPEFINSVSARLLNSVKETKSYKKINFDRLVYDLLKNPNCH